MGLAGGIIGGIIGGMVGGPWGAAVGAGLGAYLTRDGQTDTTPRTGGLEAWFLCLGKLAKADGIVTRNEADFIQELLRSLELPAEARKKLIDAFNRGKTDPRLFPQCVQAMAAHFPNRDHRASLMRTFCVLAVADGGLDDAIRLLLISAENALDLPGYTASFIAENFHTRTEDREPRAARSAEELAEAYRVLEVPPDATDEEIKLARRKKLMEYHPDRIQGKGLPDSFIQFAAEQTRRINDAYELIRARRG